MTKKPNQNKMFVIRKYIMAKNASEALRKERNVKPDDVWVDDEWKKGQVNQLASAIGFQIQNNG